MRSIRIPPVGIFFQRHRQKSEGVGKVFSKGSDKNPTSRNLIIHRGGSDYKWNVPILYHLYGVNIRVFCKLRPEKAMAYFLSYKWGYGPIVIDHLRKFMVDKHLAHSFGMLAVSFQLLTLVHR